MARKKNSEPNQGEYPFREAGVAPPQYETAIGTSNTTKMKKKHVALHSCKCLDDDKKKDILKDKRTWQSITNMYGDTDTTRVWNDKLQKPTPIFKSKNYTNEEPQAINKNCQNNEFEENNVNPTFNLKTKSPKISLFSLYRRRKINDDRSEEKTNANESHDKDSAPMPYKFPKVQFKLKKKPKKALIDRQATGDICKEGPCRQEFEKLYKNMHKLKYGPIKHGISKKKDERKKEELKRDKYKSKKAKTRERRKKNKNKGKKKEGRKREETKYKNNVTDKDKKDTKTVSEKKKINPKNIQKKLLNEIAKKAISGQGDHSTSLKGNDLIEAKCTCSFFDKMMKHVCKCKSYEIPLKRKDYMDVKCKCSFIDRILKRTCKCTSDNGRAFQTVSNAYDQTGDPFFEMKVDSSNMRVINSLEISDKIRKLGKVEREPSCICPSRLNRLKRGREKHCRSGICEKALKNKHTTFDCKCVKRKNLIECKDSTCNLQNNKINVVNRKKINPLMSSTNTDNVQTKPLFEVMLDPANMKIINSNEINNVIRTASQNEICPTGICKTALKRKDVHINCKCVGRKLSPAVNECEKSTCRTLDEKSNLICLCSQIFSKSGNRITLKRRTRRRKGHDNIVRSDTRYKKNGVMIKVPRDRLREKGPYIRGRLSDVLFCRKHHKKKVSKRKRKRKKCFFKRKKVAARTRSEQIMDSIYKGQKDCEKNYKKKTKEYHKNQRKAIKENKRIEREQRAAAKAKQDHLNCITGVIAGFINISIGTIKTAFKIPISLLMDPVGSYIYIKEKSKHPAESISRVLFWYIRTWKNRFSGIAKSLQESRTMNVIADQIEDSALYDTFFAPKGSGVERANYERRSRKRKRRIQKRQDEAVYGCRHMLLTTMRKTRCLWFYHICPDLYPQCLSLTAFMSHFVHILIYLAAFICWTPCIISFEMCRAFLCCFLCTH